MAFVLTGQVNISWIPDGAGAMSVPSAQTLQFSNQPPGTAALGGGISVPGSDNPSTANLNTAAVAFGAALSTFLQANQPRIVGFATGGG
jgi:hypothetical protein